MSKNKAQVRGGGTDNNIDSPNNPTITHQHNYSVTLSLKEPTCTAQGQEIQKCSKCDKTQVVKIKALGHDYTDKVTLDSTCTELGTLNHTCQRCSYAYNTSIALKPHYINSVYTVDIQPTCTKQGEYSYHCKNCSYTERKGSINKLPHDYNNWQVMQASDCRYHDTKKHTCKNCTYTETIQLDSCGPHINSWKTTQEPTCSYSGTKVEYCTLCSLEQGSATIPAKGHSDSCYQDQQTGDYVYNQYTYIPYTVSTKALLIPIGIAMGKNILVEHRTVHGNGVSFDLCYTNDHYTHGDGRYYMMSSVQATNYGLIGGIEVNGQPYGSDWVDRDTSFSFMFKVLPPNGYNPHYNYLHLQYLSIGCTNGSNYESVTAYVNPRVEKSPHLHTIITLLNINYLPPQTSISNKTVSNETE